jgi:hypothetical protein
MERLQDLNCAQQREVHGDYQQDSMSSTISRTRLFNDLGSSITTSTRAAAPSPHGGGDMHRLFEFKTSNNTGSHQPQSYPAVVEVAINKNDVFGALVIAKQAAIEDAGKQDYVGEFYSIDSDEDRIATYLFEAKLPGYSGWRWAVTVAKLDEKSLPTICDVVLLPGSKALLAPNWVPYVERIQPGDLGVGDVVPTAPDDERLVPGLASLPEDDELDTLDLNQLFEFGLCRARVL